METKHVEASKLTLRMTSQNELCDSCANGAGQGLKTHVAHDFANRSMQQLCEHVCTFVLRFTRIEATSGYDD